MTTLLLSALLFFTGHSDAHEYHVSKSRINYDAETRAYQLTLHLFIDDLEEALRLQGTTGLRVGTEREAADADTHLAAYLRRQLRLTADGAPLHYTYLGKEVADDLMGLFVFLEIPDQAVPRRFTVENRLLTEVHDDQQNIVQVELSADARGYFICNRTDPTEELVFD